jgi:hypothetical protein
MILVILGVGQVDECTIQVSGVWGYEHMTRRIRRLQGRKKQRIQGAGYFGDWI